MFFTLNREIEISDSLQPENVAGANNPSMQMQIPEAPYHDRKKVLD